MPLPNHPIDGTEGPGSFNPSPRDHLRLLWERFPDACRRYFPKRWSMPAGYPNPELILNGIIAQQMLSAATPDATDRVSTAWALSASAFLEYGKRVYCLDRTLGETLLRTTPKGFSFAAAKPPLPSFLLMFPAGLLETASDGDVTGALVTLERDAFAICAMMDRGSAYTFISPTDDEELARLLGEGSVKYQQAAIDLMGEVAMDAESDLKDEEDPIQLRRIAYLCVNTIAFLSNPTPDFTQPAFDRLPKIGKHKPSKLDSLLKSGKGREFYVPGVIGRRYAHGIKQGSYPLGRGDSRGSPNVHWRAGHWRRQHYGVGNASVKLIHVEPVLVGSKRKNDS